MGSRLELIPFYHSDCEKERKSGRKEARKEGERKKKERKKKEGGRKHFFLESFSKPLGIR